MPNPENLKPKPFTSENQPQGRGRPKGAKNRATILNQWLKLKIKFDNKAKNEFNEETGEKVFEGKDFDIKISVHDAIMLALIQKAQSGDVAAIKEVQDTVFGKITEKIESENKHEHNFVRVIEPGDEETDVSEHESK